MNGSEFRILRDRLKANDEGAWLSIRDHIGSMISTWSRKEKIELEWIASLEGILDSRSAQKAVYLQFREELLSGMLEVDRFAEYKAAVFKYLHEILKDQFARFYSCLVAKNNTAWKRVNDRLYIYAAKWLSEKNIGVEASRDIFQESAITFFEKVTGSELIFETSRELKSYYFRILELKSMESSRRAALHRQRFSESEPGHLSRPVAEEGFEGDDKYFYIKKIMNNTISNEEYHILKSYYFHGDKLNNIAKSLKISDSNCRQKKLQALRKIAAIYQEIEREKKSHTKLSKTDR